MNLCLSTIDVWTFQDEFSPIAFLRTLPDLLRDGDVIAVGAYRPTQRLSASLNALGATESDASSIYSVCFPLNREEYPNGRSFELPMNAAVISALIVELERRDGQEDKSLFFDHLMAYRRGVPVVPLVNFHDAFNGGVLCVSGLYPKEIIKQFAAGLPSAYSLQKNPENNPEGA